LSAGAGARFHHALKSAAIRQIYSTIDGYLVLAVFPYLVRIENRFNPGSFVLFIFWIAKINLGNRLAAHIFAPEWLRILILNQNQALT
jgi:hypothetical protein